MIPVRPIKLIATDQLPLFLHPFHRIVTNIETEQASQQGSSEIWPASCATAWQSAINHQGRLPHWMRAFFVVADSSAEPSASSATAWRRFDSPPRSGQDGCDGAPLFGLASWCWRIFFFRAR